MTIDSQIDSQSTGFGFAFPVALDDIERIEVALGPSSVLYGANAYIGVVSIITRKKSAEGVGMGAHVQGGVAFASHGGLTKSLGNPGPMGAFWAEVGAKVEHWSWRGSVNGGYLPTPTALSEAQPYHLLRGDQPTQRLAGTLGADYENAHWALHLRAFAGGGSNNEWADIYFQDWRVQGAVSAELEGTHLHGDDKLQLQLWEHVLHYDDVFQFSSLLPEVVTSGFTAYSTELFALYGFAPFFHNRLSVGTQLRFVAAETTGASTTLIPAARSRFLGGVFFDDRFQPWPWLALNFGLRFETRESGVYPAFSKNVLLPRAAIVVRPTAEHALRLEYASAVRNPTLAEGFEGISILDGQVPVVNQNYNIESERHDAVTLGYHGRFSGFEPRAELFYGMRRQEIAVIPLVVPTEFTNQYSEDYAGGSLFLGYNRGPWHGFAHYSYVMTWDKTAGASGQTLLNSPQHIAGLGGSFVQARWEASVQLFFASNSRSPDSNAPIIPTTAERLIVNPRVAVWLDASKHWQVELSATNAGDFRFGGRAQRDLSSYLGVRVGPRAWVGLRWSWGKT